MGLEIAALVISTIATGAKMGEEYNAKQSKENALDLQAEQQTLQTQQKTLSNYDMMQKVIDAQTVQMTVRGTAFSSPSFNAIQRNTLSIGAKQQANTDIEGDIAQSNIETEKANVQDTLYAQLFGDVAGFAAGTASVASKMPQMGTH